MAKPEPHKNIDRIEYFYVIKAWKDNDGVNRYLLDHETCEARFDDGVVWNNKIGQWSKISTEGSDIDQAFCDELWNKLSMSESLKSIYNTTEDK
jgi:hypothetical protein